MNPYFQGPWLHREPDADHRKSFDALGPKIVLHDIGAAGGTPPPFCFAPDSVEIVDFEPDDRSECDPRGEHLPIAIGPEHLRRIHLNRRPTTSSLLEANPTVVSRYDWGALFGQDFDIFETVRTIDVETRGLDDVIDTRGIKRPDFLKIDVQGLSLEVLGGAERTLRDDAIGLKVEVEFMEIYRGQKTFGEVHEHLYRSGFEIFKLSDPCPWYYKTDLALKLRPGQHAFCDLTYFRGIDSIERGAPWTPTKAVQALRLFLLHDLTDTAAAFLERFQKVGMLRAEESRGFERLISEWEGALSYFYHPKAAVEVPTRNQLVDRILDANLRKIIHRIRKRLGTTR